MTLYIISTPIGNLEDITLRAIRILGEVDLILAEDTRQTGKLLRHLGIKKRMDTYNDHNKEMKTKHVVELLKEKEEIALVSDCGTPGISDPGFYIIRECIKNDLKVVPVPGANAALSALITSGLATDRFRFMGFLPKKQTHKERIFNDLKKENISTIFYESPHRIIKTLKLMKDIIPKRDICVARELTKKFEEIIRGTSDDVYERLKNKNIKGEITIVVGKF